MLGLKIGKSMLKNRCVFLISLRKNCYKIEITIILLSFTQIQLHLLLHFCIFTTNKGDFST